MAIFSRLHGHNNDFPRVLIFFLVIMYGLQKWELLRLCVDEISKVHARCAHATLIMAKHAPLK